MYCRAIWCIWCIWFIGSNGSIGFIAIDYYCSFWLVERRRPNNLHPPVTRRNGSINVTDEFHDTDRICAACVPCVTNGTDGSDASGAGGGDKNPSVHFEASKVDDDVGVACGTDGAIGKNCWAFEAFEVNGIGSFEKKFEP